VTESHYTRATMGQAIGESMVFAFGLAVTTLPIVAIIFMALVDREGPAAVAFVVGWIAGTAVGVTVFIVASDLLGSGDGPTPTWVSVVKLVLGVGLLVLAVLEWRSRPAPGTTAPTPTWAGKVAALPPTRCAGLGAVIAVANPKNLAMVLGGGLAIADARVGVAGEIVAGAVFVVVATLPAIVLVVAARMLGERAGRALRATSAWLQQHNAAVMAVLFLVIGVVLVVNGAGGLR